jgi:drug/metabolite transporter (DMT)-like permease
MIAALTGIIMVIVAVVLWLGNISTGHALAILIGILGVLIILGGLLPGRYLRRGDGL